MRTPATRSPALLLLVLATGACTAPPEAVPPPPRTVVFDLAALHATAARSGPALKVEADEGRRTLRLSGGGSLSFALAAPGPAAVELEVAPGDGASLTLTVERDGHPPQTLLAAPPARGPQTVPLPGAEGEALRLSFHATGTVSVAAPRVSIEGSHPADEVRRLKARFGPTYVPPARPAPSPAPPVARPDLLVYVMDALGADDLSCYGAPVPSSPHVDRLSREGFLAAQSFSQAPATAPSVKSLFTSRYLPMTGSNVLPDGPPTLAEALAAHGYRTASFSNNPFVGDTWRITRGFSMVEPSVFVRPPELKQPVPEPKTYAEELSRAFWAWHARKDAGPFFAYLQSIHPHAPYTPPDPWNGLMTERRAGGPEEGRLLAVGALMRGDVPADPGYVRGHLRGLYREDVAYNDWVVGRLLAGLRRAGSRQRTLVFFLADHGEEFLEHGGIGHGTTGFDEVLHVPLVAAGPGLPAGRILPGLAQNLDVAPTLLDLCGGAPSDGAEGRSLVPRLAGREVAPDAVYAAASVPPTAHALRTERYKYIHAPGAEPPPRPPQGRGRKGMATLVSDKPARGREAAPAVSRKPGLGFGIGRSDAPRYLYDLALDPGETHNIVEERPILAELLHARLTSWLAATGGTDAAAPTAAVAIDAEECARLRALGYVGQAGCPE